MLHKKSNIFVFSVILFSFIFSGSEISAQAQATKKELSKLQPSKTTSPKKIKKEAQKKPIEIANNQVQNLKPAGENIISIFIEGNKKIENDAIIQKLVSKVNSTLNEENVREDILALFKMNYFLNIEVSKKVIDGGVQLFYKVFEKPSIVEIEFDGFAELKKEELQDASGLKNYEIYNPTRVKEAQDKVQKFYEDKGFFLAKIDSVVEEIKKDESVRVTFKVEENDKVKVKKITFIGNKKLSDNTLKDRLITKEQGFFTGMSGSGAYKQEAFERDMQILRFVYWNQGYVQAKIDRPQVTVTPDKKGIFITVRIEEGEQFDVGDIEFSGDILFTRDELFETIKIDDNKVFSSEVLQKDLSELQAKYGDLGYAYANVMPRYRFRESEKKVDLVFEFEKGNKVYFGKINMVGNTKTRDKVLRRELKIQEGELYNETRKRESIESIQRLGFFEEVNFKASTPDEQPDVMNLDITVKERSTGQIQFGAGYSTTQKFTLQGSVQQTNFLGKGQNLGVTLNYSQSYQQYDLNFTEPYFNDTLWSLGGRVFKSDNTGRTDYNEMKTGASVSVGHPITDKTRFNVSYGYTKIKLTPALDSAGNVATDYDLFPLDTASGDAGTAGLSVEYDSRNDRFRPSKGHYGRIGYSYAGLGGSLKYQKGSAEYKYFKNLFWDVVWRNSMQYSQISTLDGSRDVPFNELYVLGGPYSLRGFRYYQVGKMKRSTKLYNSAKTAGATDANAEIAAWRYFGGTQQALYQTELQFPLIKEADMFGVLFYDIGEADDVLTPENLYSDVGFGIRWFSPIGPLRFEWGFPLKRDTDHQKESFIFEFSIGTPF